MNCYIIKNSHTVKNKEGKEHIYTSYFQRRNDSFLTFNVMSNKEEAKKFDCKSEAARLIKKYFRNTNTSKYEVVKITQEK